MCNRGQTRMLMKHSPVLSKPSFMENLHDVLYVSKSATQAGTKFNFNTLFRIWKCQKIQTVFGTVQARKSGISDSKMTRFKFHPKWIRQKIIGGNVRYLMDAFLSTSCQKWTSSAIQFCAFGGKCPKHPEAAQIWNGDRVVFHRDP